MTYPLWLFGSFLTEGGGGSGQRPKQERGQNQLDAGMTIRELSLGK